MYLLIIISFVLSIRIFTHTHLHVLTTPESQIAVVLWCIGAEFFSRDSNVSMRSVLKKLNLL